MSDTATEPRPPSVEELKKFEAEAEKLKAEARKEAALAAEAEHKAAVARIALEREEEKRHREILNDDFRHRRYHFDSAVGGTSVEACIKTLKAWHREDPQCDIEVSFSSPGGSVIDGMELFDFLTWLRQTHSITTSAYGMAASMAGILLQAGTWRVCGRQAYILIHEVSFGAGGKIGEVEDELKFIRKMQKRVLDIFAERCQGAAPETATKRLTRRQLARAWERKDWWIDADEALAFGLVDEIR